VVAAGRLSIDEIVRTYFGERLATRERLTAVESWQTAFHRAVYNVLVKGWYGII